MWRFNPRTAVLLALVAVSTAAVTNGLHSWAQSETPPAQAFSSPVIDLGVVCSDVEKSIQFYRDVIGFSVSGGFKAPPQFALDTGLSNSLELDVHVLTLGDAPQATKLKLMQFKTAPGARVDQSFIHSTYGIRYLTIHVTDVKAALARLQQHGVKPVAKCPVLLPEGFPPGIALLNVRDPDGNLVELVGPYTP